MRFELPLACFLAASLVDGGNAANHLFATGGKSRLEEERHQQPTKFQSAYIGCFTGSGSSVTSSSASGDSASGDSASGDSASGDSASGDSTSGDSTSGDSGSSNSASGGSGSSNSASGDSASGDSSGSSNSVSGDSASADSSSADAPPLFLLPDSGSSNSASGDNGSSTSASGDSASGDSGSSNSVSGDSASGDSGSSNSASGDSGSADFLLLPPESHGDGFSIAECLQVCEESGYPFAALQWHGYCSCFAGHSEISATCNTPCNEGEGICGGDSTYSVFKTGEVDTGITSQREIELQGVPDEFEAVYEGCFKDQSDRDLPVYMGAGYSIGQCLQLCGENGYKYAGLQYYSECYCGNEHTDVSASCTTECRHGDGICGGPWANSVYETSVEETGVETRDNYVGCFKDQADRDLPLNLGSGHTIDECVELCGKYNYIYAGLQYYSYCFCGDEHTDETATCNTPCKEGGGMCGGGWANSVYETGSEGGPKLPHTEYLGECAGAVGAWWGDPHMISWDDKKWDCQGQSEFVLVRSGDFEVQGRFEAIPAGDWVTATKAMAVKNGDLPIVQVNIVDEETANSVIYDGCPVEVMVDGVVQNPDEVLAGDIEITVTSHHILIQYPDAGPAFEVGFDGPPTAWHGCTLDAKLCIPTEMAAEAIGLLGTPDGDNSNDFMDQDGNELDVDLSGTGGFDYCTTHWCLRDESESYFTYTGDKDFDYYENCSAEPPKKVITKELPQTTIDKCQGSEACLVEAEAAQEAGEDPDTAAEEAIEDILEVDETRGNEDPDKPTPDTPKVTTGCELDMPMNGGDYCPHDVGVRVLGVAGVEPSDKDVGIIWDIEALPGNEVAFKVANPFVVDMKMYTSYVRGGDVWTYSCEESELPSCGADDADTLVAQCVESTGITVVRVYFVEKEAKNNKIFGGAELDECCHPDEADLDKAVAEYAFEIQCDCPTDTSTTSRRLRGT